MWQRFKKNKFALLILIFLGLLYFVAIFADFFSPYRYDDEKEMYNWAPPVKVHFINIPQRIFRPYIYGYNFKIDKYYQRIYTPDTRTPYPIHFFIHGFKYKFLGLWETNYHLFGTKGGRIYLLGADLKGRDIFSRLIYGARISLSIGLLGVAISFFIGMIVGGISGYFGGWRDNIIMRVVEMVMMIPGFYLMLALRASFPPRMSSTQIYLLIVVILSFIGWASIARVIRGMSLSLRKRDFVLAAKAVGLSTFKIIIRHILPHTFSYILVAVFISVPGYIIGEAALSLSGLGIQEHQASWGNMLALVTGIVNIQLYPWMLAPGFMILIVTCCFNIVGDTLRDILDPKREIL